MTATGREMNGLESAGRKLKRDGATEDLSPSIFSQTRDACHHHIARFQQRL